MKNQYLSLLVSAVMFCLAACSIPSPKLSQSYLPIDYDADSIHWPHKTTKDSIVQYVPINQNPDLNQKVISFWRYSQFNDLYSKNHPVVKINSRDIITLDEYLDSIFNIYFVSITIDQPLSREKLTKIISKRIGCQPLSNIEIRFSLNLDAEIAFPKKSLTMLVISSHELLLQHGAIPLYPRILSTYLQKKYNLPKLNIIENSNLFATRNENIVYSANKSGFIFCTKREASHLN